MNSDNTLRNISLLAFAFVAIVVLVNLFTTNSYKRSNRQLVQEIVHKNYIMDYYTLHEIATSGNSNYQFADIRSAAEFEAGHLPGAIHISFEDLLKKEKMLPSGKTVVLYADKESTAHNAWLLLRARGKNNIMVLGGNFDTAMKYGVQAYDPAFIHYGEEKAKFDYRRFMHSIATEKTSTPASIIPSVKTEVLGVKGGC
jgi:3-mercaptopyruvate sulfurtransferase SseA